MVKVPSGSNYSKLRFMYYNTLWGNCNKVLHNSCIDIEKTTGSKIYSAILDITPVRLGLSW
jgi:hypothetical protein